MIIAKNPTGREKCLTFVEKGDIKHFCKAIFSLLPKEGKEIKKSIIKKRIIKNFPLKVLPIK